MEIRNMLSAFEFQLKDIVLWRRRAEAQLDELVRSDEIAEAVAKRMIDNGTHRLTRVQTAIASCAVLAAILSPILSRLL